jgi:hypothetical protein
MTRGMMIRYVIEAIAKDGNAVICISVLPESCPDEGHNIRLPANILSALLTGAVEG